MIHVLLPKTNDVSSARPMTLLQELQARIQARSGSGNPTAFIAAAIPPPSALRIGESSAPSLDAAPSPDSKATPSQW